MRVFRALSLDVVVGAACGGLLAESMAGVRMLPGWWIALLTAVWSIYTGDHLLDARRAATPLSFRLAFHRRHERLLTILVLAAVFAGLGAAATLRPPVRVFGVGLSVAVILYLASAQGMILTGLPKEPIAGLLYAAGIWGGPLVMGVGPRPWLFLAASLHAVAAILNLTMIGVFETEEDRSQHSRSIALKWGLAPTRRAIVVISILACVVATLAALTQGAATRLAFIALAVQSATPGLLLAAERWSREREKYRIWGDAVFLTGAAPRLLS